MAKAILSPTTDILFLIDLQPKLLTGIHEGDRVLRKAKFLFEIALLLDVPVLASEQNPEKLGALDAHFEDLRPQGRVLPKMEFSALGNERFRSAWERLGRKQTVSAEWRHTYAFRSRLRMCFSQVAFLWSVRMQLGRARTKLISWEWSGFAMLAAFLLILRASLTNGLARPRIRSFGTHWRSSRNTPSQLKLERFA